MRKISRFRSHSAEYACGRMKLLLTSERVDCSQQMINLVKEELVHTVKQYFTVKEEEVSLEISQETLTLHFKVPVTKIRNENL